jgi:hypothetical protein
MHPVKEDPHNEEGKVLREMPRGRIKISFLIAPNAARVYTISSCGSRE